MSIMASRPASAKEAFSLLITSPGCSNMLRERRNCFLGLCRGLDGLRMCPTIGDPILRKFPFKLVRDCLNLGGPIGSGAGECADCGLFSP